MIKDYQISNFRFSIKGLLLTLIAFTLISLVDKPGNSNRSIEDNTIKLGLLITTDTSKDRLSRQAVNVVNFVLEKENAEGGIDGKKVEVIVKACDGSWGSGSKQAVSLIYDEGVRALIGFVDGRTAHLIEQVCTKAQVPFMSTFSPDPTLSKINIPWFFSSIPNADQQSEALINEIYLNQKLEKIYVISSDDHDASHLAKSFIKETEKDIRYKPELITYRSGRDNFKQIVFELSDSDGVAFFGDQEDWGKFFYFLKFNNIGLPLFCPIMELDDAQIVNSSVSVFTIKPDNWEKETGKDFKNDFKDKYHYSPGILASYISDGTMALIEAMKTKGTEPREIQEALFEVEFKGISGDISFHPSGKVKTPSQVFPIRRSVLSN